MEFKTGELNLDFQVWVKTGEVDSVQIKIKMKKNKKRTP